jgi:hypothetical protein
VTILSLVIHGFLGCSTPLETGTVVARSEEVISPDADGISVIHIEIEPSEMDLTEKLLQFGEPITEQQLHEKLLREGIQIRRVDAIDVPAIIASIGIVLDESYVWHGQILKWRDLYQRRIGPQGMLISEQGIPYFIQRGFLSLLSRGWVVQRESGYHIYLQFQPTWHIPREKSPIVGNSSTPTQSKVFSELAFETLLQDGEAIIIAVELCAPAKTSGPQDDGPPPVRLGEALLGGPVKQDIVQFLVIEANIMPRG